jgi:hypothetical protein
MSRKNFLNEINKMTRKGVYPSLNILLEEKDEDAMGGDNPFGDSESGESEEPEGESEEASEEPEGKSEEDVNADTIKMDQLLKQLKQYEDAESKRTTPTSVEAELLSMESLNLLDYMLINESEEDPQKLFDKLSKSMEKNKDTIDKFGAFSAKKINGIDLNIDDLVLQAAEDVSNFFSKEDPASIIGARYLKKIRKLGNIPDIEKSQEEFVSKLQQKLDKGNVDNVLPNKYSVNSIENTDFKNAKGGFNRG